jgi:hypothetical protein
MNIRRYLGFVGKFIVVLVATTFVIGLFSYPLLTKEIFESPNSQMAKIYRTQTDPELWNAVYIWIIPVQVIRSILLASVLYIFYDTLIKWNYWKRVVSIASILVIVGHLAGSSGIIEGLYMMRPEFVTPEILARTLPEPIIQGACISLWFSKWIEEKE